MMSEARSPGCLRSTLVERLWSKIEKRGPSDCWLWTGASGGKGGPTISIGRTCMSARRALWADTHPDDEPLPKNRVVYTSCENQLCMNPGHHYIRPFRDHEARFWMHVNKNGPVMRPELGRCWLWTSTFFVREGREKYGQYGQFGFFTVKSHRTVQAHRYAWELTHGPIEGHVPGDPDKEVCVLHKCDNPPCVNPSHLFLGSDLDNNRDMRAKGRWRSRVDSPPLPGTEEVKT